MDCNSNLHGYDTPDALFSHRGDDTSSLLRETMHRVDDMAHIEPMHMDDMGTAGTHVDGSEGDKQSFNGQKDTVADVMLSG